MAFEAELLQFKDVQRIIRRSRTFVVGLIRQGKLKTKTERRGSRTFTQITRRSVEEYTGEKLKSDTNLNEAMIEAIADRVVMKLAGIFPEVGR